MIRKNVQKYHPHPRARAPPQEAARYAGTSASRVFRSEAHIYAQVIDDTKGITVVAASSMEKGSCDREDRR